jgi:hypothetical protein
MTTVPFENVLFKSTNTVNASLSVTRTPADRWSDVFNVKDFGALGNFTHDDTSAIQAAIDAAYSTLNKSAIVFFPPGAYKVMGTISLKNTNIGSNFTSGVIRGAGRWSSSIFGNLPNGFVFDCGDDGSNSVEEISNLSISNTSSVIGSGALRINNTSLTMNNLNFGGMINVYSGYNVFQTSLNNCTGGTNFDPVIGSTGSFGIMGFHFNIEGWRSGAPYQAAIQFYGSNSATISGCGIEQCNTAWIMGVLAGWASACTVASGANSYVLTVGGTIGQNSQPMFIPGCEIFMSGLTTLADWVLVPFSGSCAQVTANGNSNSAVASYTYNSGTGLVTLTMTVSTIINPGDQITVSGLNIAGLNITANTIAASGTTITYTGPTGQVGSPSGGGAVNDSGLGLGFAGKYRINRNSVVSSPVPCVSRFKQNIVCTSLVSITTEGNFTIGYVTGASSCSFINCGGSSAVGEAVDPITSAKTYTAQYGIYIDTGLSGCTFMGCLPSSVTYGAQWYFTPGGTNECILLGCFGRKHADNVTDAGASISNSAGGAGVILNFSTLTAGVGIGLGMKVTGSGVSANTIIVGNSSTDRFAVNSYTYNSGTGAVVLTLATTPSFPSGTQATVSGLNVTQANGTFNVTVSGTTVSYTGGTGGGAASGGGTISLSGFGNFGSYRVNNSQHMVGQITVHTGDDWVVPTNPGGITGITLIGCNTPNLPAGYTSGLANGLSRTFSSLPGNVGSDGNYSVQDGMEYDIVDGLASNCSDSACTAFGANVTGGGGALHLRVRYNAATAHWRITGI